MPLSPSSRLGPYEILAPLGAGGMGEVYRARDTRLERTVAIKVLPSHLAANPEFRQRFEREARVVSSLNHPHICILHDIGQQGETAFLVMEYLDGETLAARLAKDRLPLEQALRHAVEIAGALAAAHRQGVSHRDLKPGNVMLTRAGAKLLDFGLAKVAEPAPGAAAAPTVAAPAISGDLTQPGAILGTVQYMAPEQLEGKPADARTDLFAFGALLYEMVTGRKAFHGGSQASAIGAILHQDPPAMAPQEPLTPPALERLVRKCLAKDPEERWQSARDFAGELEWIAAAPPAGEAAPAAGRKPAPPRFRWAWPAAGALVFLAALPFVVPYLRPAPAEPSPVRFTIAPPEGGELGRSVVLSPDGRRVAFVTRAGGKERLWVRSLDALEPQGAPPADYYDRPFWSPDSRYLAFFSAGKLYKLAVGAASAQPELICECRGIAGAWSRAGVIVHTLGWGQALARVAAGGSQPTPLTSLDASRQEHTHLWPQFLPDDRHFLFLAAARQYQNNHIFAGSLDSKERKPIVAADSFAGYLPRGRNRGYLFYVRRRTLLAQPFDESKLALTAEPLTVAENLEYIAPDALAVAGVSEAGVLAYQTASVRQLQLTWLDRSGKPVGLVGSPADYGAFRIAPDGKRVAVSRYDSQVNRFDIWSLDLARGLPSRVTFDSSNKFNPVWSPDGGHLAYYSDRDGAFNLFHKPLAGSRKEEVLLPSADDKYTTDWSSDGRFILFHQRDGQAGYDIWALPGPPTAPADRKPVPVVQSEFNEKDGSLSPDGNWIAYSSDESGRDEVYVQRFRPGASPAAGERWQVSDKGGSYPRWRQDGKELYYLAADQKLMAVEGKTGASGFAAGVPQALFEIRTRLRIWANAYDPAPDGRRFLVPLASGDAGPAPLTLVLHWKPEKEGPR